MTVLVDDGDVRLHVGDLMELLPTLEPGSVEAIVTSPPYSDAREDVPAVGLDEFPSWAAQWLPGLRRVLTPSGSLMLNLGRRFRDRQEHPYWIGTLQAALACGFEWADTVLWHKVNGGGGRRTAHLIDRHELVLWLARDAGSCYRGFDEARQPYSPATVERYQRNWRSHSAVKGEGDAAVLKRGRTLNPRGAKPGSVFVCSAGADKGNPHPSPMPRELAAHLIRLACPPGGLVLDPFAGSCTTGLEARLLGRRAVLFELSPVHAAEGADRLAPQRLAVA